MPSKKVDAITGFLAALKEIRAETKEDALAMLKQLDIKTLADREALKDFLYELAEAATAKHLLNGGKVRPKAAAAIRAYVKGMVRR